MNHSLERALFDFRKAAYAAMHCDDRKSLEDARGKALIAIDALDKYDHKVITLSSDDLVRLVKDGCLEGTGIRIEVTK